jgi:activator of 2-hydroxyglutaryl-CoA dehydratase/predicted nucleotide-binding protein (sugar kinase/HSP70/actin superfamily)
MADRRLSVGIDVGSTTVKTVVMQDDAVLAKMYERHGTRQAEVLRSQLAETQVRFPGSSFTFFITGSGSGSIAPVIGATFVQEVNAVEMAVDTFLPGTGSIIELGGQDAKIIVFKNDSRGNRRSAITMNDKCAGGTGSTIDRILHKAGVDPERAREIPYSEARIHRIAARCGVFAETDVVCLLKMGIPETEIVPSLFNAIVKQNLEVLTRGNLLRERVLLLGGPNRFFPGLVDCWRAQIPRHWEERGHRSIEAPVEKLICCPPDAEFFAAIGAVLYGTYELDSVPVAAMDRERDRCPLPELDAFIGAGRLEQLAASGKTRRALVKDDADREEFIRAHAAPEHVPPAFGRGDTVRVYLGIDGGSTSTKGVLVDEDGELVSSAYRLSAGNPLEDTRAILEELRRGVVSQGARLEILGAGATGYAGKVLGRLFEFDSVVVETVAHMLSAIRYHGQVDVICDVGGQDIKILFMKGGRIRDFRFNTQCSAGNGYFLQSMASQFHIPLEDYAEHAFSARLAPSFLAGCAVFMEQEKVNLQQLGWSADEMLAGLALVLPLNIWQYIAQVPDLARYGHRFVLQGGTQRNLAAVKAQIDYIKERVPGAEVFVHRYAAESGAIGAALEAMRRVARNGRSTFVGIDRAIALRFETRNDETTTCPFCANRCSRTFIDARTPDGKVTRYICGFSCEKGSVESKESMRSIVRMTRSSCESTPNLVQEAYDASFAGYPAEMLEGGGSPEAVRARRALRVGIPRALTMHHSAPFFSTFLRALGVGEVVFSAPTTEKLWDRGGKWGTIDPCFPAKVANAHVYDLLKRGDLDAILFPMVECFPSHLEQVKGNWACTIQTATPEVVEASFTKGRDHFVAAGVEYMKPLVNLERRRECEDQLFEYFRDRLHVTRAEVSHAVGQGYEAFDSHIDRMRRRGREVVDRAVRDNDIVIVVLGRPYHDDPGLNHGILRKFQLRGYPVIGLRSLPVDDDFLAPLFTDPSGRVDEPAMRGVIDVWQRAYNFGANRKLWAAKVVARHPNLVALELASFKCGYDYSISGYLERIAEAARSPFFMFHDLDQNRSESALDLRVESISYFLDQLRENLRKARPRPVRRIAERRA